MKSLTAALLLLLPGLCRAEHMVRATAWDVIERMHRAGVMVCFEEVHGRDNETKNLSEMIQFYQKIPDGARSPKEEANLIWLRKLKEMDTSDGVIAWCPHKTFDFEFPDAGAHSAEVLDALVAADPDYTWEKKGMRYVVYPRQGSINALIAGFHASKLGYADYLAAIDQQILWPRHVGILRELPVYLPSFRQFRDLYGRDYSMELGSSDLWTALNSALDPILPPNYVWVVLGAGSHGRALGFIPVRIYVGSQSWN
ncbi:hypothetical protein BH09VER1_BH09VER1_45770 [soil metagenome]